MAAVAFTTRSGERVSFRTGSKRRQKNYTASERDRALTRAQDRYAEFKAEFDRLPDGAAKNLMRQQMDFYAREIRVIKSQPRSTENPRRNGNPGELLIFGNPRKRRQKNWTEEVRHGSRVARITANQPEGPYTVILYVNNGEDITHTRAKAQTLKGARSQAQKMVTDTWYPNERRNPKRGGKARLTPEEDRFWTKTFEYYASEGMSDSQADAKAWQETRAQFPRLKAFRGALPRPASNPRRRNVTGVRPGSWVHTAGRSEVYRVAEMQGGHGKWRYLLEGPYPSKARTWTNTGRVYLAPTPNPCRANPRKRRADRRNPHTKTRPRPSVRRESARATSRRRRRNPGDMTEAVTLFQSFHGKDPREISERQESAAMRLEYTALGALDYIKAKTPLGQVVTFNFDGDGVKLASSPDGLQLYAIGGNQNVLPLLDADSQKKDFIDLGDALEVQYVARKVHGGFQPVSYYHKFGEKTGALPRLMFDKLKKRIFFIGGDYKIDSSKGVSPGIEN
jgi:hypothetical protein